MPVHLTQQQIEGFRRRTLSPDELITVAEHLGGCDSCRAALLPAAAQQSRVAAFGESFLSDAAHLEYEQISGLMDDKLTPQERAAALSHLAFCAACANEVKDLAAFKASLAPAREPAAIAAAPGLWQRLAAFLWPSESVWPRLATAGLAVLLLLVGMVWWRSRRAPAEEITRVTPTPTASMPPATPAPASLATPTPAATPHSRPMPPAATGELAGLEADQEQFVKQALAAQRLELPPDLAKLTGRRGMLAGDLTEGAPFGLLGPVGEVVLDNRPAFRWQPLAGAESYVVTIYDRRFERVAVSPPLTGTAWRPAVPLPRGAVYSWQVTARKGGQNVITPVAPAPEARFKVLDAKQAAALARLRQRGASPLARGLLYARAGLLREAAAEFQAQLKLTPGSAVVKKFLRDLKIRGQ